LTTILCQAAFRTGRAPVDSVPKTKAAEAGEQGFEVKVGVVRAKILNL
jgi:hypothetical protein